MMEKKNIAIVYGGFSSEKEISVKSGKNIAQIIDKDKFNVFEVLITPDQWEVLGASSIDKRDFSFFLNGKKKFFDAAVIVIHGNPGENGILQSYFELIGLPYLSCNALASALTFNKFYVNKFLQNFSINLAPSIIVRKNEDFDTEKIINELGLPVFVKPNAGGSSFATFKVKKTQDLKPAILNAFEEGEEVIVEKFIKGTELTCAVLNYKNEIRALTPVEIVSKNEFFDYEAKYNSSLNEEIIPARVDNDILQLVKQTSEKIYSLLNCNGIVRIDYIFSQADKKLYFLELNSIPGMTSESIVPKIIKFDNLNITEVFTWLINNKLVNKKKF